MSPIRISSYTRLRTILIGAVITILSISLLAYVGFQARFLIEGPVLSLAEDLPTVQRDREVIITGAATNATSLTLNGRQIVTDERGTFRERVVLENGYTLVRIEAHDRYGRSTHIEQPFVFTPESLTLAP